MTSPSRVRVKATSRILHVYGPMPKKVGDAFEASWDPPETIGPESGCTFGERPDGTRFFECSRRDAMRRRADGKKVDVRRYRFDDRLHEIVSADEKIDPTI